MTIRRTSNSQVDLFGSVHSVLLGQVVEWLEWLVWGEILERGEVENTASYGTTQVLVGLTTHLYNVGPRPPARGEGVAMMVR